MIEILGFYALICAAMFYLGSRALITESLWRLYPAWLARFMDCAACTGFWWGLIWSIVLGQTFQINVGSLPWWHIATPLVVGLCMIVLTPIAAGLMQYGFDLLGVTVDAKPDPDE